MTASDQALVDAIARTAEAATICRFDCGCNEIVVGTVAAGDPVVCDAHGDVTAAEVVPTAIV